MTRLAPIVALFVDVAACAAVPAEVRFKPNNCTDQVFITAPPPERRPASGRRPEPARQSTAANAPSTAARPGPDNTGPNAPGALAAYAGPPIITVAGTVIENARVTGKITVRAANVTLRNFVIDAGGASYGVDCNDPSAAGLMVEDGEILNVASAAVYGYGCTLRRLNIHDSNGDGVKPNGSDFVMEACWVSRLGRGKGAHADGVQVRNVSDSRDFTGLVFRGNHFDMPVNAPAPYKSNACIYLQDETENAGRILGAVIENNWLNGGNYTLDFRGGQQEGHVVTGNRFGRDYRYGPVRGGAEAAEWSGNVFADDGARIIR